MRVGSNLKPQRLFVGLICSALLTVGFLVVMIRVPGVMPSKSGYTFTPTSGSVTVNGSQTFQTINGLGVNINSLSWKNGELRPALDLLADMGVSSWRVVYDMTDWEGQNDNSDPNVANWTYYNVLYSNAKFQNLWGTLQYLNQKGITTNVALSFMGPVPTWMGGSSINSASEDEFVEMIATLLYYARNREHVVFDIVDPMNEPDQDGIEGPLVGATQYTRLLRMLSVKLDATGLGDIRFLGPNTAGVGAGVNTYMPQMMSDSIVMAKVDHFGLHDYGGSTGGANTAIKSSAYPTRNFWMTEFSLAADMMSLLGQSTSGLQMWDAYDSVYEHGILGGRGTTPPNDAGNGPALLAYNRTSGTYAPRHAFYEFEQLFKFVPPGSVRVGTSGSPSGVTIYTFYHQATGRVTIVGRNTTASAIPLSGTLSNLPAVDGLQMYQTDVSGKNFARGNDVVVGNGSFYMVAPVKGYFTLTTR